MLMAASILTDVIDSVSNDEQVEDQKHDDPAPEQKTRLLSNHSIDFTRSRSRVLLADKLGGFVEETLSRDNDVVSDPSLKDEALRQALATQQPNVLVVRSTKIKLEHLEAAKSNLALIVRAGAGVNTIDCAAASNMGIFVANCPGKWMKSEFGKARGLCGRTLSVVGVGNIGREVCKRALAFGMRVRGFSRSLSPEQCQKMGIEHTQSVAECVSGADALSVHLPRNESTHHIIDS